jgi:hypothetical protein
MREQDHLEKKKLMILREELSASRVPFSFDGHVRNLGPIWGAVWKKENFRSRAMMIARLRGSLLRI